MPSRVGATLAVVLKMPDAHKRKIEGPRSDHHCHREERSDVAISRYCVRHRTVCREIATPFGLAMTW